MRIFIFLLIAGFLFSGLARAESGDDSVTGLKDESEFVHGDVSIQKGYGDGYVTGDDGQTHSVMDVEETGNGSYEGYDAEGDSYGLESDKD
ncbi:MAG: hypothetical protein ISS92_03685 [Candidatus Omnitrophica bacterium]|nr:hypothetical protein [Candidatus Omnitrophota bacterium]